MDNYNDIELDLKIQRNKLKLKRYEYFNWKVYFLRTFAFLFVLDIIMLITIPQNLSSSGLLVQLAISLWVIILVCTIFTPLIAYWYRTRYQRIITELEQLKERKRFREGHKTSMRFKTDFEK